MNNFLFPLTFSLFNINNINIEHQCKGHMSKYTISIDFITIDVNREKYVRNLLCLVSKVLLASCSLPGRSEHHLHGQMKGKIVCLAGHKNANVAKTCFSKLFVYDHLMRFHWQKVSGLFMLCT